MSEIFISYARSTEAQAHRIAEALRALGYEVWRDDLIPAHEAFGRFIEERLAAARVVLVLWSAEGAQSEWVRSEASRARTMGKLVQLTLDGSPLPMPFDQIQCADLASWSGEVDAPGWRKVVDSIAAVLGRGTAAGDAGGRADTSARPPVPATKPSIAVLPFANRSGDLEQDYFADGMVEEIVQALSRFKTLFVIASGSSLSLKGKGVTPQEAARTLGVRYVLEGSVRKAGGRVRITAELIDAVDGMQIWADRFDDTLEDVFELQDKVALSVAAAIEPSVRAAEVRRTMRQPTENMNAYELYLRGHYQLFLGSAESTSSAAEYFDRAIELDPEFALALGFSAMAHAWLNQVGSVNEAETQRRRAIDLAQRAVRAGDDDAVALTLAAAALLWVGEGRAIAAPLIERAMTLNPGSFLVWHWRCLLRLMAGDGVGAVEDEEMSMRLDPLSPLRGWQLGNLGMALLIQRRFSDAISPLTQAAQLTPHYDVAHVWLAACQAHLGQTQAARESLARARSLARRPLPDLAAMWFQPDDARMITEGLALAEAGA